MESTKVTEYFDFLRKLRAVGISTKIGAIKCLRLKFQMSQEEARAVVEKWNWTYGFKD